MVPKKIATEVDLLMNLLKGVKEISIEDAARTIGSSVDIVEQWATLLEEERVVSIRYKFTTPYISLNAEHQKGQAAATGGRPELPFVEQNEAENARVKETIEKIDELTQKAEGETKKGEFGLIKLTLPELVLKVRALKESLQISTEQKIELEKKLNEIEQEIQRANFRASSGQFDLAHNLYNEAYSGLVLLISQIKKLAGGKRQSDDEKGEEPNARILLEKAYFGIQQGNLEQADEI